MNISAKLSAESDQKHAPEHQILVFPTFASALGGAQSVRYSERFAWITQANGSIQRMPRSKLPPVSQWTAFNLANLVQTLVKADQPDDRRRPIG